MRKVSVDSTNYRLAKSKAFKSNCNPTVGNSHYNLPELDSFFCTILLKAIADSLHRDGLVAVN